MRAERTIRPAGGNTRLVHPRDLLIERVVCGNIRKRRLLRGRVGGGTGQPVEERRSRPTLGIFTRVESAARVPACNSAFGQPVNVGGGCVRIVHVRKPGPQRVVGVLPRDIQHLRPITCGTLGAVQVAGGIMQVQQKQLTFCPFGAVHRQRSVGRINEQTRHA